MRKRSTSTRLPVHRLEAARGGVSSRRLMASLETVCEVLGALPGTVLDPRGRHPPAWRVEGRLAVRREPRLRVPDEDAIRAANGELIAMRVDLAGARG